MAGCLTVRAQTINLTCSRGTNGWWHSRNLAGNGRHHKQLRISVASISWTASATCIPAWLRDDSESVGHSPNLLGTAQCYLNRLGRGVKDMFHHVFAVLHDPTYRTSNAGALRIEWSRIPRPG